MGLVIADVSGKGIAAAFFMAVTRTMLKGVALAGTPPSDCLARVNEALCRENPLDMFVTVLYAELDEASGAVQLRQRRSLRAHRGGCRRQGASCCKR